MYCTNCGSLLPNDHANFCYQCGKDMCKAKENHLIAEAVTITTPMSSTKSFETFMKDKGRQWNARVKKKKKENVVKEEEVTILIGLMEWRENDDRLKEKRGKRIPCKVLTTDTRAAILIKGENRWRQHHPDLYDNESIYTLVYESGVKIYKIPGTEENFLLHKCRKEVDKEDYKRITLYFCKQSDLVHSTNSDSSCDESPCKMCKMTDDMFSNYYETSTVTNELFPFIQPSSSSLTITPDEIISRESTDDSKTYGVEGSCNNFLTLIGEDDDLNKINYEDEAFNEAINNSLKDCLPEENLQCLLNMCLII